MTKLVGIRANMINYRLNMRVLATNDDGISSEGLKLLVKELGRLAEVVVVAPNREQSAIGTAVTLRRPLRVNRVRPVVPGVETYAVNGTPADSVILALSKLVKGKVDLVVSGINRGLNLGDDVLISGTVSAALQGYLRGLPALAVSADRENSQSPGDAAKVAAQLARSIGAKALPSDIFLNINLPGRPIEKIAGVKVTQLARRSHIDTVEEDNDGNKICYRLVRRRRNESRDGNTDIWAVEQGNISITPLHTCLLQRPSPAITDSHFTGLLQELANR